MAGPYDPQGNGIIHSFSFCSKQKDFFPQRRASQKVWAVLVLVYTMLPYLTLIQLKIFMSILPIFDSVLFFAGGYVHLSERQLRHMIDSGINKWHIDKATVLSKETSLIHMQYSSSTAKCTCRSKALLKLCPREQVTCSIWGSSCFRWISFFLTDLHWIFMLELLKPTSFTSH